MKNRSDKPPAPSPLLELLSARSRVFVSRGCVHPVPRRAASKADAPSLRMLGAPRQVRVSAGPPSLREPGRRAPLPAAVQSVVSSGQTAAGRPASGSAFGAPRVRPAPRACLTRTLRVCVSRALLTRTPVLLGLGSPSGELTITLEYVCTEPVSRSSPVHRSSHSTHKK